MFAALEYSLTVLEALAPLEPKLRAKRKSLADQVARAAESVALNIAEGRERAPADFAVVDAPLDHVRAILWRLTH